MSVREREGGMCYYLGDYSWNKSGNIYAVLGLVTVSCHIVHIVFG